MSVSAETINPEYTLDGEKRIRTKVACDYCRKRKSKCDGEQPCSKCVAKNRECAYNYKPKERKKREVKPKPKTGAVTKNQASASQTTIQQLSSRIGSLESLLGKLITRLSPDEQYQFAQELNHVSEAEHDEKMADGDEKHDSSHSDSSRSSDDDDDDDEFDDAEGQAEDNDGIVTESQVAVTHQVTDPKKLKEMLAPADKGCLTAANMKRRLTRYLGSHCLIYAISEKSLSWLKTRIEASNSQNINDIFAPLRNVPLALEDAIQKSGALLEQPSLSFVDKKTYFDGIHKSLIFEIIDKYYNGLYLAPFLCDISTIRGLFQIYFYGVERNDETILSGVSYSDLLIMNISVALCLLKVTPDDAIDSTQYPHLASKPISYLQSELLETLFDNSMECYEKVSRVNEGIRSLMGLSLLIMYIELTYITDFHINYTITSLLIRYAKEIGIHRVELLVQDIEAVAIEKRKLWWFCEYMGMNITYKSGKPTLVNMEDVTTLTEVDDFFLSIPKSLFLDENYVKNATDIYANSQVYGTSYYFAYYMLMISRIRAKAYNKLYANLPLNINTQGLLTFVNEVNDDLKMMNSLMIQETAPLNDWNNKRLNPFPCEDSFFDYHCLELSVTYFSVLLAVNRAPFMKNFGIEDERLLTYGNNSLTGARKLLQSVKNVSSFGVPRRLYASMSFYPLAGFCSLIGNCLVYPKDANTLNDSILISEAAIAFFSSEGMFNKIDNKRGVYDVVTRLLVRVLADGIDKQTGVIVS
ncbi:STB4 Probable transcriptional regulatory protein STB4 [Candida maltosa Xu316]